jgi:hypothetical protein
MDIIIKTNKKVQSTRNAQGIKVKRCCLSCTHKFYDSRGRRLCDLCQIPVGVKDGCDRWEMHAALKQAGLRPGKVKRKDYLRFVLKVRSEEKRLLELGQIKLKECLSLKQLRTDFGKKIYELF